MSNRPMGRYVALPLEGYRDDEVTGGALQAIGTVRVTPRAARRANGGESIEVLDAIRSSGARLVEMSDEALLDLRLAYEARVRIVPLVFYRRATVDGGRVLRPARAEVRAATPEATSVLVRDRLTGKPIRDARIVAFTNYRYREGEEATTGARGRATLALKPGTRVERLYVFPKADHWGHLRMSVTLIADLNIALQPIDLAAPDLVLQTFRARLPPDAGAGIRVAIVDTGVDKQHPALPDVDGVNMVFDETRDRPGAEMDWGPARRDGGHGTHVAGIVAARPPTVALMSGVAPGANIMSYRVFPHASDEANSYDIAKAIDRAVADECRIINLSLGGGQPDELVRLAIRHANERGCLVVAAAGNDGRKPVSFPAANPGVIGVSAYGRRGSFPAVSPDVDDVAAPFGKQDRAVFFAGFSNFGPQIDGIGPGVAVVSTLPGGRYGAMSGTSMAAPAIAGFAAHLASIYSEHLAAHPTDRQSSALFSLLMNHCNTLGFGLHYEGFGVPAMPACPPARPPRRPPHRKRRKS